MIRKIASAVEYFEFTSLADVPSGDRVQGWLRPSEGRPVPDLGSVPQRMQRDLTARVAAARAARSSLGRVGQ